MNPGILLAHPFSLTRVTGTGVGPGRATAAASITPVPPVIPMRCIADIGRAAAFPCAEDMKSGYPCQGDCLAAGSLCAGAGADADCMTYPA